MTRARARGRLAAGLLAATLAVTASACSDDSADDGGGAAGTPSPSTAAPSTVSPSTASPSTTSGSQDGPSTTAGTAPATTVAVGAVEVALTPVAELQQPVAMAVRPGDDEAVYVAARVGTVHRLADAGFDPQPLLDISGDTQAGGERGLLGLAFHPEGTHLYLNYTDRGGDTHVDEWAVDAAGRVDPASRRSVLVQEQPYPNHNGGHLAFGPDGYLYVGLGDGGSAGDPEDRAQDLSTLLGKMLRIDPRPSGGQPYGIPPDNPFVGQAGARPEIWSFGLRNPWRYSFDRATGDLWIGDVGQRAIEEIDLVTAASGGGRSANFGWNAFEGTRRFDEGAEAPGAVAPVHEYGHGQGECAVTAGYVYRGAALPGLVGAFVYADFCVGEVRALRVDEAGEVVDDDSLGVQTIQLASFGEDQDGELYALSLDGQVLRLSPPG